ncbi:MAG: hypothetical protein COW84_03255 [Gammaproteobacteria bacterium CG22_combo_CG10-13_8_21_14_all_40_8]|nr:MAG: hypothetical protein COW84_03255 [Gammaproteobacteria bacterium CG22_combo_CG10-13_8_21_14_all_40_8]
MNSSKQSNKPAAPKKKAGPQGTMIFSAADVEAAIDENTRIKILSGSGDAMLVGINAPFDGQIFHLTKVSQTIGRKLEQDLVLDDPSISSLHAQITQEEDGWKIINLLSSNGTFLNGKKISISPLKDGDKVHFGQAEFIFKTHTDDKQTPTKTNPNNLILIIGGVLVVAALIAFMLFLQ